jgi:hypothetical protein
MVRRLPRAVIGGVVLVAIVLVGGAGWWFLRPAFAADAKAQLAAASGFVRATLAHDAPAEKQVLPPDTVAAMPADYFTREAALWSHDLVYQSSSTAFDGSLTLHYGITESSQFATDLRFDVGSASSDQAIVHFADSKGESQGTITVRRIGGQWLVARYQSGSIDLAYWLTSAAPSAIVTALGAELDDQTGTAPTMASGVPPAVVPNPATAAPVAAAPAPVAKPAAAAKPTVSAPGTMVAVSSKITSTVAPPAITVSGTLPNDYVRAYCKALVDKKWAVAYGMQPASAQQSQALASYSSVQAAYALSSFAIVASAKSQTCATVVVHEFGAHGDWTTTWAFKVGGGAWIPISANITIGAPPAHS